MAIEILLSLIDYFTAFFKQVDFFTIQVELFTKRIIVPEF